MGLLRLILALIVVASHTGLLIPPVPVGNDIAFHSLGAKKRWFVFM
jgi:hypothetical protein